MTRKKSVDAKWLVLAFVALALTVLAIGFQSGSCASGGGDLGDACTSWDATNPARIVVILAGLGATSYFAVRAFRR